MKKTLSVILTLCMLLGLCSFSVAAAPEGTAITDAAGFAAMDPAGTYYLANDITVDATYAGVFAGVLDGNGKTITTSALLFEQIGSATIKNLKVAGSITTDRTTGDGAAVIAYTTASGSTVVFDNVENNCSINATAKVDTAAFIGRINWTEAEGTTVTIKNCTNNADITGGWRVAAFLAYCSGSDAADKQVHINIENCVNNGAIVSTQSYAAGFVSRFGGEATTAGCCSLNIKNSTNNGTAKSASADVAGFVAYARAAVNIDKCVNTAEIAATEGKNMRSAGILSTAAGLEKNDSAVHGAQDGTKITNCINTGKIIGTSKSAGIVAQLGCDARAKTANVVSSCINLGEITINAVAASGTTYLSGVVAYIYGGTDDTTMPNTVENCLNAGNITGKVGAKADYVSGLVGYFNGTGPAIANNLNLGTITTECADTSKFTLAFWNNNAGFTPNAVNNYSVASAGVELLEHNTGAEKVSTTVITAADAELVTKLGAAWKMGDKTPEPIIEGTVGGTGADFSAFVEAPDTTEPGTSTPTGDSALVFAAIAAISVLGVAVVAKKREN